MRTRLILALVEAQADGRHERDVDPRRNREVVLGTRMSATTLLPLPRSLTLTVCRFSTKSSALHTSRLILAIGTAVGASNPAVSLSSPSSPSPSAPLPGSLAATLTVMSAADVQRLLRRPIVVSCEVVAFMNVAWKVARTGRGSACAWGSGRGADQGGREVGREETASLTPGLALNSQHSLPLRVICCKELGSPGRLVAQGEERRARGVRDGFSCQRVGIVGVGAHSSGPRVSWRRRCT